MTGNELLDIYPLVPHTGATPDEMISEARKHLLRDGRCIEEYDLFHLELGLDDVSGMPEHLRTRIFLAITELRRLRHLLGESDLSCFEPEWHWLLGDKEIEVATPDPKRRSFFKAALDLNAREGKRIGYAEFKQMQNGAELTDEEALDFFHELGREVDLHCEE